MYVNYRTMGEGWAPAPKLITSRCPVCNDVCVKREYSRSTQYIHAHIIGRTEKGHSTAKPAELCSGALFSGYIGKGPKEGHYLDGDEIIDAQEYMRRKKGRGL